MIVATASALASLGLARFLYTRDLGTVVYSTVGPRRNVGKSL